jgi:hypothetical protein
LDLGWTFFKSNFESGRFRENTECEYSVSTGFMNLTRERRKLILRGDQLIVSDSKQYPLHSIISMTPKQGDQNCSTKLTITVQTQDGTQQKEFSGLVVNEMMRLYSSFLMQAKALAEQRLIPSQ